MARRSVIIPVGVTSIVQPLPYSPFSQVPGIFPNTPGFGPQPFSPFGPSPFGPFGLPPLPGFLGGFGSPPFSPTGQIGPFGNLMNLGLGNAAQNTVGGWLGGINQDLTSGGVIASMGGGVSGIAKINNVVVPPSTGVGVPFTLQLFFTNNSSMAMQFQAVLNIQGLGLDMTQLPPIAVQPGQAGSFSQNLQIGPDRTAPNYPGSFQLVHHDANGMQILDDQTTFTIPAPSSMVTTMVDAVTGMVTTTMMPAPDPTMMMSMAMPGTPDTTTPMTTMTAASGAMPTLPSTPGAGIVPPGSMTAMSPMWNPNDPMHMRHGRRGHCKHFDVQLPTLPMGAPMGAQMALMNAAMMLSAGKQRCMSVGETAPGNCDSIPMGLPAPPSGLDMMTQMVWMHAHQQLMNAKRQCMNVMMGGMAWQDGMLINGHWVENMPKMDHSITMHTDELGQTTTTETSSTTTPMMSIANPLMNNNMDFGFRQDWGQINKVNQLPINSAMNNVPGSFTMMAPQMPIITPPVMPIATPPLPMGAPGLPGAGGGGGGGAGGFPGFFNQGFGFGGFPGGMQMQRTSSFQFMPWTSPNTGQPGMLAVPMMSFQPRGFMVPGAMLEN